jgi:hypothetical protein
MVREDRPPNAFPSTACHETLCWGRSIQTVGRNLCARSFQ